MVPLRLGIPISNRFLFRYRQAAIEVIRNSHHRVGEQKCHPWYLRIHGLARASAIDPGEDGTRGSAIAAVWIDPDPGAVSFLVSCVSHSTKQHAEIYHKIWCRKTEILESNEPLRAIATQEAGRFESNLGNATLQHLIRNSGLADGH